jgi:DNA-binding Xre family transcriptional regulator
VSTRINPATFERMCSERGRTPSDAASEMGISSSTLAKIRKGEQVSQATVEKAAAYFENLAVQPRLAELLAS